MMLECHGCGKGFKPEDVNQVECPDCRDTNPNFITDRAMKVSECGLPLPEEDEQQWQLLREMLDDHLKRERLEAAMPNETLALTSVEEAWFNRSPEDSGT